MQCWLCENEIQPEETEWTEDHDGLAHHWLCTQRDESLFDYDDEEE